jgi:hypothetical protein
MSTLQPRCSQRSTRKTPSRWSSGELEDIFRSTRTPAILDYEVLGGLLDLDTWDYARGVLFLGYRMGHGPCLTSAVTIRSVVGLLI